MKKYLKTYGILTLLVVGILGIPGIVADRHIEQRYVQAAKESLPKTVLIRTSICDENPFTLELTSGTYLGSGVLITSSGHVLTVAHLFNHRELHGITLELYNGRTFPAKLLAIDFAKDLALVKIDAYTPDFATLTNTVIVGQEVIAIGQPLAIPWTVTHGIISYVDRDFGPMVNVTQSDVFINQGNSGGPLFNLSGELVGINSFMVPPVQQPIFTGLGFSVSPKEINKFLDQYRGL